MVSQYDLIAKYYNVDIGMLFNIYTGEKSSRQVKPKANYKLGLQK